jgi:hypothetical protein
MRASAMLVLSWQKSPTESHLSAIKHQPIRLGPDIKDAS